MRPSWSWLRTLFRRPPRAVRAPPPADPAQDHALAPLQPRPPAPGPALDHVWADDVDEDDWGDDDEESPHDEPDPFISGASAPAEPVHADLRAVRAYARMQALGGEHRIGLSSPAGPGSLAEALNRLVEEGLVDAQFVEDEEHGPHIVYRPAP